MSIEDWHSQRTPWSTPPPVALPERRSPEAPSRLSQDLAALTRVLLGIADEERPAPEPLPAQEEPAAPASSAKTPLVELAPVEAPAVPDGRQRLRSVLSELAFLDD